MKTKQKLGQFFTTNSDNILQGFESYIKGKEVLDPFAGNGDLLKWAEKNGASSIAGYDIDQKLVNNKTIYFNDSLNDIPHYDFIITNPPYLAKNKMSKSMKNKYMKNKSKKDKSKNMDDLYLLALKKILIADPNEGIIIIPINFFSAENSDVLRKEFLSKFKISRVNYFTEQVFEDTTYNVVAFHFINKRMIFNHLNLNQQTVGFYIFPNNTFINFTLDEQYNYRIAGEALEKINNTKSLEIVRLTEEHIKKHSGSSKIQTFFNDTKTIKEYSVLPSFKKKINNNIILLNCIDTNANENGWIKAEDIRNYKKDCLVGKISSRNIAYVMLPECPIEIQEKIIKNFNEKLNSLRKQYNSLFLTNFRDNDRKRVSFEFCYKLITYCYRELM